MQQKTFMKEYLEVLPQYLVAWTDSRGKKVGLDHLLPTLRVMK